MEAGIIIFITAIITLFCVVGIYGIIKIIKVIIVSFYNIDIDIKHIKGNQIIVERCIGAIINDKKYGRYMEMYRGFFAKRYLSQVFDDEFYIPAKKGRQYISITCKDDLYYANEKSALQALKGAQVEIIKNKYKPQLYEQLDEIVNPYAHTDRNFANMQLDLYRDLLGGWGRFWEKWGGLIVLFISILLSVLIIIITIVFANDHAKDAREQANKEAAMILDASKVVCANMQFERAEVLKEVVGIVQNPSTTPPDILNSAFERATGQS